LLSLQVPMDQPLNGLAMITRFTRNKPLAEDKAQAEKEQAGEAVARKTQAAAAAQQRVLPGATWQLRRAMPGKGEAAAVIA